MPLSVPLNPGLHRPTLFVVDDQPINIQTLFAIFGTDHGVIMATSGAQALERVGERRPDLILLDVVMPEMDGHEVCRRIKADPLTCDIPIIFATAHNNAQEESLGLQLGAVDFISKPVHAAVVRARVQSHLLLRAALGQIRLLNDDLEARVVERTQALNGALGQLRESQNSLASSDAKATLRLLVAGVSHELGSLLGNSAMAASSLTAQARTFQAMADTGTMKRSGFTGFLAALSEGTDLIQKNLSRASELLGHFRQVAADQASEQRRPFDVALTVGDILHTLNPSLRRHAHRVVLDIPPGIIMDSQPGALGQVVINLVNNAYLHAFEHSAGGVLSIRVQLEDTTVRMAFEDNGVGISPANLDKLFEPFFSTKIGKGGTGLGMAIVHNLVTKTLCGAIQVTSAPGQGTRVEIELPQTLD